MAHQIDYAASAGVKRQLGRAAERAVMMTERDFVGVAMPKPIETALPAAVMAPDDGMINFQRELGLSYPATLPSLLVSCARLAAGETRLLDSHYGAGVMLILEGGGSLATGGETVGIGCGDILCIPGGAPVELAGGADGLRVYLVDDSPMVRYFGWRVIPDQRTSLTHYPAEQLARKLDEIRAQNITASGVFLSHRALPEEKLCTPNLFAHLNRLLPGATNTIHAHAAAAITYVIKGGPGAYSLLGREARDGEYLNPQRVDWRDGQVSITPPNLWHSHYNDSDQPILSLVIQLSGTYYNDRTMNFLFSNKS